MSGAKSENNASLADSGETAAAQGVSRQATNSARAEPPGARESGAGDQFHFLWAARRAIELLNPASELKRIRMEGFSPDTPLAADADLLLGVDLVEYYGSDTFEEAALIVVSQLKYSTRHPDMTWTAARMCSSSRAGASACKRLAEAFTALRRQGTRANTLERVRLRLVSNRPVSDKLRKALEGARELIQAKPRGLTVQGIVDSLSKQQGEEITRLRDCASLKLQDFFDFLSLLELSDCGAESRELQELRLSAAVARHLPDYEQEGTDRIYRAIEAEALPEGADSRGLTREDILVMFKVSSEAGLFPVPARFEPVSDPIVTSDVRRLAVTLQGQTGTHVIAHGDAGVGKTTTLSLLESELPAGSVVVAYDCFGGGAYLDPSEARYRPQRAVLQIVNELAVRCGTPLLLRPPSVMPDLWRALKQALEAASAGVSQAGGILVLAVDAADNAQFAAQQFGEQSFVSELWQLPLPQGARLLVTARTHRVDLLYAPETTDKFELSGFDETATATFLRRHYPLATDEECADLHTRTGGNPRVLFYVLDVDRPAHTTLATVLDKASKTPDPIFKDLVDAAIREVPDQLKAAEVLGNLVCSARPVRIASFAEASGLTIERGRAFCHGLAPGVRFTDDTVAFRDEDFETYVRQEIGTAGEIEAHRRLAGFYLLRDQSEVEAATVVGEHLFRGEQYGMLIDLTLGRGEPMAIEDSVIRLQVYRRRLTFALRAALIEGRPEDAFRLTVLAGEARRSDSALESIIRDHPDLAMRHGDPRGVAEIYLRQENRPWRGPLHLRVSAMYARAGECETADEHFRYATAWLREAISKQEEDPNDWHIAIADIAAGADAVYWRQGLHAALDWLNSWRPEAVVFAALNLLAIQLVRKCELSQLERQVSATRMSARFEAVFRGRLWAAGIVPERDRVQRLAGTLERSLRHQPMTFVETWVGDARPEEDWLLDFVEMGASVGLDASQLLRLARSAAPSLPKYAPSEWDDLERQARTLKRHALEAALRGVTLTVDELLPEQLTEQPEAQKGGHDSNAEDRRRFREIYGDVLPVFALRARVLVGAADVDEFAEDIGEQLKRKRERNDSRWSKFDRRYRLWAITAVDAALRTPRLDAATVVQDVADVAEKAVRGAAPSLWLDLASLVLRRLPETTVETLLDRAVSSVEGTDMPATDRVQVLLGASSIADALDASLAEDYYRRGMDAAAGIDDDSIALLELQTQLAMRINPSEPQNAEIAARMVGLLEEFEQKVSDPDRLPRLSVIRSTAAIHAPTAFATVSRWDDEDRISVEDSVTSLIHGATSHDFLDQKTGVSLLVLGGERLSLFEAAEPLLERLKAQGPGGRACLVKAIDELSLRIRRDVALWSRPREARLLSDWATAAGMSSLESIQEVARLADYADAMRVEVSAGTNELLEQRSNGRDRPLPPLATAGDLRDQLKALAETYVSDEVVATYVVDSGRALAPRDRLAFLEAIGSLLPTDRVMVWYARGVSRAFAELLNKWRRSTPVIRWARMGVPSFIESNFAELIGRDREAGSGLDHLLALPLGDDTTTILLRAVASALDELSAHQLFAVARSLASLLADTEVREVLLWSIARLESTTRSTVTGLPDTPEGTLAQFLFAFFGSVDKRKRWRAAHAARSIVRDGNQALVDALMALTNATTAGSFMSSRHTFYWLSARQWLMLVIARVSDESPEMLRTHLDRLTDLALSGELPHIAIRDMAKRAALAVNAACSSGLSAERLEALLLANEPRACYIERKHRYTRSRGGDEPTLRFKFDSMDTLPYWYSPLSDVFGVDIAEVSTRSEKWIVDYLGFTEEDTWKDRRELARERQWELMSNRQGTIPVLESLDIYLKYHGMLLAAGQLIDEGTSVGYDEWDEPGGRWGYWLSDHVESSPHWWLSDLRSPAPLEPYVYREPGPIDEWRQIASEDFDRLLTIENDGRKRLVVHSYVTVWSDDRHEYLSVRAALVSPETSHALMRALQAADANDFFLPFEKSGESSAGQREIFEGEFELKGLLADVSVERGSMEERDPLARIRYSFDHPGKALLSHAGAQPDRTGLEWRDHSGDLIAQVTLWKDELGDERDSRERHTEGTRTTVSLDAMLGFLAATGYDLIIDAEIDRKEDRRDGGWDREYEPAKSRIYILNKDGQLESVEGISQP
ncbi:MAG: ATP-binding protein [Actinomycetota bacterium]|nr:ATP-binding protein [Actinomycetota bacterium]